MMLLTQEIRRSLPALYATAGVQLANKVVRVKFFDPCGSRTWYGIEFDGADRFFGWVDGWEGEWGYFSLAELQSVRVGFGLGIERDRFFTPCRLGELVPALTQVTP